MVVSATVSPCARTLEKLVTEGRRQERYRELMQSLEGRFKLWVFILRAKGSH